MWPFRKRAEAHATTVPELFELMRSFEKRLGQRIDELQETQERLAAQHLSLRGRVYAIWGKGGSSEDSAAPGAATQPAQGETKAQYKARLLAEGKLVPGKPFKHTN